MTIHLTTSLSPFFKKNANFKASSKNYFFIHNAESLYVILDFFLSLSLSLSLSLLLRSLPPVASVAAALVALGDRRLANTWPMVEESKSYKMRLVVRRDRCPHSLQLSKQSRKFENCHASKFKAFDREHTKINQTNHVALPGHLIHPLLLS